MYTQYFNSLSVQGVSYANRDNHGAAAVVVNTNATTDIIIEMTLNSNGVMVLNAGFGNVSYGISDADLMVGVHSMLPNINATSVVGLSTGTSAILNHGLDTTN